MWYSKRYVVVAALIVILLFARTVLAQTDENSPIQYPNTVTGGLSAGRVLSGEGEPTSEIGMDWLYRWNPKWETGVQLDLTFEQGYGEFEGYVLVPIVAYSVTNRLPIFFGLGFEHTKATGDKELLVRIGSEYTFYLSEDERVMLIPGAFIDRVDGETVMSLALSIGYTF